MTADALISKLKTADYFADKEIAYALLGAMETGSPLLVEGDPDKDSSTGNYSCDQLCSGSFSGRE